MSTDFLIVLGQKVVEKSTVQCNKESQAVRSIAGNKKRASFKRNKTSMLKSSKTGTYFLFTTDDIWCHCV